MPGLDGTGPLGIGPMTGRGFRYCALNLPIYRRFFIPYGYAGTMGYPVNFVHPVTYAPNIKYSPSLDNAVLGNT